MARLPDLLAATRPAEVATVLATLDDAELAAVIGASPDPTPLAVAESVIAFGGPAACAALARRAFFDRVDGWVDDVLRGLAGRRDAALDEVLREGALARPAHDWLLPVLDGPRPEPAAVAAPNRRPDTSLRPDPDRRPEPDRRSLTFHLERGTLIPADLLGRRPASMSVVLAAPVGHTVPRHPARPGCAALRAALEAALADRLGEDPLAWAAAVSRVDAWPGPLTGLLADSADGGPRRGLGGLGGSGAGEPAAEPHPAPPSTDPHAMVQASNVLLAAAPPRAAAACLEQRLLSPRLVRRLVRRWPLCRTLAEHVLSPDLLPEDSGLPRLLAANDLTPDTVLARLIDQYPDNSVLMNEIATREFASGPVRLLAIRRHEALHGEPFPRLARLPEPALATALAAAGDDPAWLNATLRRIGARIPVDVRLRAYATLTALTGPEAVWAAELQASGGMEHAAGAVRASMAAGLDAPILAAARHAEDAERARQETLHGRYAVSGAPTVVRHRAEAALDDPLAWPREDLVRTVLDGRPERWRALIDLLRDGESRPWEELIPSTAPESPQKEAM